MISAWAQNLCLIFFFLGLSEGNVHAEFTQPFCLCTPIQSLILSFSYSKLIDDEAVKKNKGWQERRDGHISERSDEYIAEFKQQRLLPK